MLCWSSQANFYQCELRCSQSGSFPHWCRLEFENRVDPKCADCQQQFCSQLPHHWQTMAKLPIGNKQNGTTCSKLQSDAGE